MIDSASRYLIVNADDFGENKAVNDAIMAAYEEGILTSASLMVRGEAVDEAVAYARAHPDLKVGLHLALLLSEPCLPSDAIPHLVNPQGWFPANAVRAGMKWFLSGPARAEIQREVWAQAQCFMATGLPMDHVNGHLHFHVHPAVFPILLEAAQTFGAGGVRLPWEPWRLSLALDARPLATKLTYAVIFGLAARVYRPRLQAAGIFAPRAVFGVLQTGRVDEDYLVRLLPRLPAGVHEFYAHPRLDTPQGRKELQALISPRVREILLVEDIQLTTYSEAAGLSI